MNYPLRTGFAIGTLVVFTLIAASHADPLHPALLAHDHDDPHLESRSGSDNQPVREIELTALTTANAAQHTGNAPTF